MTAWHSIHTYYGIFHDPTNVPKMFQSHHGLHYNPQFVLFCYDFFTAGFTC